MITIRPFRGLRPPQNIAANIACQPYDVLDTAEARIESEGNPQSFYHIDKPEIDLADEIDHYSEAVYAKGKENLDLFIEKGWLKRDGTACLYVYAQEMNGRRQTGLVAGSWVEDYLEGRIKKHELTRDLKEKDRMRHMMALGAHTGKVFLAYNAVPDIDLIISEITRKRPEYDFTDISQVRHLFWVVKEEKLIHTLVTLFAEKVPCTYIADGHHRAAAAAKTAIALNAGEPDHTGLEPYNYFLSVLFPSNQLYIMDYNRVVKDLNGLSQSAFLQAIGENFSLELVGKKPYHPESIHKLGLYLKGSWYCLTARPNTYDRRDPIAILDVTVLTEYILKPILRIDDQRTSDRIDYVGGIRGLEALQEKVDSGEMAAAFSMYPASIQQLMDIADSGNIMPPKSTWFEPKLKSGLVVNLFTE